MSKMIRRSLSLILTVALIFTSVVPAMADSDYAAGDGVSSYSETADTSEDNDVSYGANNEEGVNEGVSEQQEAEGSEDVSDVSDPEDTDGSEIEDPDDSAGENNNSASEELDEPAGEEPGNSDELINEPNVEEPIDSQDELIVSDTGTVAYDPQPETLEDVQAAIDNYIAAEYEPSAKPHWEYEVDASLMPEGWECVPVTGDEEFGADYYTISEIVQTGEIVITSEELIYFMGDRGGVDFLEGITAVDAEGNDISELLEVEDDGGFDKEAAGTYYIEYVIREEEDVIASHTRSAAVIETDITINAVDALIYAQDYQESNGQVCGDCGEAHETPDAETLRQMAMLDDVYGWDSNNHGIGNVQVIDDGGFTLDKVDGGMEASFTVKYAVFDEAGTILAKTQREITVRQIKISLRSAVGRTFGGDNADGSIRLIIDDTGYVRELTKRIDGTYNTTYYYCVVPRFAWWIGNVQYASNYTTAGDWMNSTGSGNRLGTPTSIVYSEGWTDAYNPTTVQTQKATLTWTKNWGNGGGTIDLVWIVSYVRGMGNFTHEWRVINNTGAPISDQIDLYYGGHHMLGGGSRDGWSYFDAVNNCIYTWKDTVLGMYIFRSDGAVEPASYHAMTNVNEVLAGNVRNRESFNGIPGGNNYYRSDGAQFHTTYYMQWKSSGSVAAEGTWKVEATEGCLSPGDISVIAPAAKTVPPGVTVPYSFTVMNMTIGSIDVDLTASLNATALSNGWSVEIDGPTKITLNGISDTKTVNINVHVPDTAKTGDIGTVTLIGKTNTGFTSEASTTTTTVDEKVAAITEVSVNKLTSEVLDAKVTYSNHTGSHLTTVEVYSFDGTHMYSKGTATISSGGVVTGIDVSMLTNGETYRLKVTVNGIEYPHNSTTFTYYKVVTVSFNSNGGSTVASQQLNPGSKVVKPTDPTRSGYAFVGWYKEAALTNQWNFATDTVPIGGITLYAKWTGNNHYVTYKANGGTGNDIYDSVSYGDSYTLRAASAFTSANSWTTLQSWNTAADGKGTSYSLGQKITISGDLTLYAIWGYDGSTTFTVTYYDNVGSGSYSVPNIKPGDTHTVLTAGGAGMSYPTAGYILDSWNTAANGSGKSYAAGVNIVMDSSVTLYAQWKHDGTTYYRVTYNANGGSGGSTVSNLMPGSSHTVLGGTAAGVSLTGYVVSSWNTATNGSGTSYSPAATITLNGNVTLYAQWVVDTSASISVTYDPNGGTGGTTALVTAGTYHTILSMSTASISRYGYKLKSWNTAADGSGTSYSAGTRAKFDNNVTLYAQWNHDGSTYCMVTYDANGGTGGKTVSVIPETNHTVLDAAATGVARKGYEFKGWSTSGSVEYAAGSIINVGSDTILYAVWEYDGTTTVDVIYDANGGIGGTIVPVRPGVSHTLLSASQASVTKQNYALQGWSASPAGGIDYAIGSVLTVSETITLYAVWDYDISLTGNIYYASNSGDAHGYEVLNVIYGTTHTVLDTNAVGITPIPGMDFMGWNTAADGSGTGYDAGDDFVVEGDKTLYAQWQHDGVTYFKVTYLANGGTGGRVDTMLMPGKNYTVLTAAQAKVSRTNYIFNGWADASGAGYAVGAEILLRGDLTLSAQWVVDGNATVNVTYNANGGTGSKTVTASLNGTHTVLSAAEAGVAKYGYVLQSWNTAANGSGNSYAANAAMPLGDQNVTLYAQWVHDGSTYVNVKYDANRGTGGTTVQVEPDTSHAVFNAAAAGVSRLGHTFKGWSTDSLGNIEYTAGSPLKVNSSDITLYAIWGEYDGTTVNVAYDANSGSGGKTVTGIIPGENHTALSAAGANVSKTGHILAGWSTNAAAVNAEYAVGSIIKVDSSMTLYAVWTYDGSTKVSVTYNANGGAGGKTITGITPGGTHTVLDDTQAEVTKQNCILQGWSTTSGGSVEYHWINSPSTITVNDTLTLYAVWAYDSTINGNVYYDSNHEDIVVQDVVTEPVGTNHTVLGIGDTTISPISGQIFTGWNTAADGSGTGYSAGDRFVVEGDITLYAQWQHDGYTYYRVTYMANGGTGSKIVANLLPGSYYTILMLSATGINRPGYDFTGWNTAANGSGISYAAGSKLFMRSDVTLYAQYVGGVNYTLTYKSNDIRGLSYDAAVKGGTANIVLGQTDTGISDYVIGFTFAGWNTAANGSGTSYRAGDFITVNGDMSLYAQWVHDGTTWCKVQCFANGGTGSYIGSFLPATTYTMPTASAINLKRTGYTFTGWNTAANGSGTSYAAGETIILNAEQLILYAQWTR